MTTVLRCGIVLYGPPASGKDTVTRALSDLNSQYGLFPRLKVGAGRSTGYALATPDELGDLQAAGRIIWSNHRYGSTYAVDRDALSRAADAGIPVVHLGQPEAVAAVTEALPNVVWLTVSLWCPRHVAESRLHHRGANDVPARLRVWDDTPPLGPEVTHINTARVPPTAIAALIRGALPERSRARRP